MMVCINQVNAVNGRQLIHEHGEVMASWRAGAAERANAAEANLLPEPSGTLRQIVRLEFSDSRVREWYARMIPLVLLFIEGLSNIRTFPSLLMFVTQRCLFFLK
jgi:hypothetical protein